MSTMTLPPLVVAICGMAEERELTAAGFFWPTVANARLESIFFCAGDRFCLICWMEANCETTPLLRPGWAKEDKDRDNSTAIAAKAGKCSARIRFDVILRSPGMRGE